MPRKLLLADDSVTIQRVIELTFADEDIQVIAVGDGRQAIERVERERPDIILADVGMPERDGYEVAAFVKSHPSLAQIPVILLTGAFEPIDESRAHAVGCDGVLVKPFEPQMVISRVRDLLAGRRPSTLWSAAPLPQGPVRQAAADVESGGGATPAPTGDSLEAYFDRLDAAFAGGTGTPDTPAAAAPSAPPPAAPSYAPPPEPSYAPPAEPESIFDEVAAWDPDLEGDPGPASAPAPAGASAWPAPGAPASAEASAAQAAATRPPAAAPVRSTDGPEAAPAGVVVPNAGAAPVASPPVTPPSLVEAFAALLTAEQRTPIAAPAPSSTPAAIDERTIDEIARRVLSRFEEQSMRPAVLEVAERLVREEIERLKQNR
jgi:CheY-like chemotaxis protein